MSIRQRLTILLLLIGLLPTLLVSAIAYITISNELNSNTANQLISTTIKQEQKINALLQAKQEEVIKLTNKYDFQVALGDYLIKNDVAQHEAITTILQSKKIEVSDIQSIVLSDLDGTIFASTVSSNEGTSIANQEYFLQSGQDSDVTVKEDERDGINKLYIASKVSVNKRESAVLIVVYRIDDIVAAIQDYTGLGTTGETIVAEQNKDENAISLFPLRFDTDAALKTNVDSLQLFTRTEEVYNDVTDYRGKSVIVAPRSIGFANWIIATKIDRAEALAPIVQLRNSLIGIVLATSILIAFIALWVARYFTEPILRIARTAMLIGRGDLSVRVDVVRNDEIGTLGSSINAMGQSLKEFVTRIDSQRHRLEIILNSTEESILAINKQGTILIANNATAAFTAQDQAKIVGSNITDIFAWMRDAQHFTVDYAPTTPTTYSDLQFVSADGTVHYATVMVAPATVDQSAQEPQVIVTIRDETKSRELEDMKVDFVSMAAHELRTPLAAIRGYLELVSYKDGSKVSQETQKYLKQALKSTTELGSLINNLLDVTRIERGTLTFDLQQIDLQDELQQAVNEAQFVAKDKQISLEYAAGNPPAHVYADRIAIREVINNLITNAIKYTNNGGRVTVILSSNEGNYSVKVKDTGMGIPKNALPNLFTKFYRVHGGLNSGSTGTGLGLFIAKSIIERHNGTINVTSQEGIGSEFSFSIPKYNASSLATDQPSVTQDANQETRRKRGWTTKNIAR